MLYFERLLAAPEAALRGSFGDIYHSPRLPHAVSALKYYVNFNQSNEKQSRNQYQDSCPRTLMNNRRTLSLTARPQFPTIGFAPPFTLQDQADNSPPG